MNAPENATIIEVTNDEEHKYLGIIYRKHKSEQERFLLLRLP